MDLQYNLAGIISIQISSVLDTKEKFAPCTFSRATQGPFRIFSGSFLENFLLPLSIEGYLPNCKYFIYYTIWTYSLKIPLESVEEEVAKSDGSKSIEKDSSIVRDRLYYSYVKVR
jgi:hypothetical protein